MSHLRHRTIFKNWKKVMSHLRHRTIYNDNVATCVQ